MFVMQVIVNSCSDVFVSVQWQLCDIVRSARIKLPKNVQNKVITESG